jgi:molybdenum cofactor guanylyltransferase
MTIEAAGAPATYGLILAGGLARRMGGGDKTLIPIGEKTILERAIARLGSQCAGLLINANGDLSRFSRFGLPVVPDDIEGFAGPLAGILAGLDWVAANAPATAWIVSVPGDCPFLPHDLVARLHGARSAQQLPLACARSGEWRHPVVGLWPVGLRHDLRNALEAGVRKIEAWTGKHGVALAEWPADPVDPFFNVNTPEDAAEAERMATDDLLK